MAAPTTTDETDPDATADAEAPYAEPDGPPDRDDDDVLEELRDRRTDAQRAWKDIREEGRKDVMCVAGDVWAAMDPDGLRQRQEASRPSIAPDELGQYINQVGNDVRQNKRSIKATPISGGADKKSADFIQGRLRQIEYRSNAQRDVYSPIFEDALQRSYGFGRFVAKRVSDTSRSMELWIEAFPNPDVVLPDPDGAMLAPDCSKIEWCFILDASRTRKQFKREFPTAQVVDFTDEHARLAPDWIKGDNITLAEYWVIERVSRRVVFLKTDPAKGLFWKDLPTKPADDAIDYEFTVDVPYVCQYLTNGVELLAKKGQKKRTPWPGKSIPIFSCFGKVLYVQGASGTQRRILSMVRLPRQPVMYYSYVRSCQAETIGGVPRATWVGYEGQFRGHEVDWQKASHEPVPFLTARPFTEATGNTLLPLPVRQSWDPPLQNLEMAAEGARRSIQAAMGTSPLPTEAQRVNQKSGKALDRIESSGQKGTYHFVDHLDGMVTRVGQLGAELIPFYDDTMGDVMIRNGKDEAVSQRINDPNDPNAVMVSPDHVHDITISVGPYAADEREASSDFADTIVGNQNLLNTVGPQKAAELTALAIRLKAVGPIGDEMADIISPREQDGAAPPTPQQVKALTAQGQQLQQENQQLQQAIQTDQAKQQATLEKAKIDAAASLQKADKDAQLAIELQRMKDATSIAVAKIAASAKGGIIEQEAANEALALMEEQAHEVGLTAMDQQHERDMAAQQHQQALEQGETAHAQALEANQQQGEMSTEQAEAQRAHAAEMAQAAPAES
jgi:hypothetical protein